MDANLRDRVQERLEAEPTLVAAWIFGSVARGEDGPRSDLDVAVFVDSPDRPRTLADLPLDLEADLAELAGREAQVVVVDWAPSDLVHRVLRDGVLLLDRDPGARVRFEVASRNRYFDMLPIWRTYRQVAS